jgi:hypothetical protein
VRVRPSCFLLVKMCLCQVSLLSRWRPRYLTSSDWGSWTSLILTSGQVARRVVKVTWVDLVSLTFILHRLSQCWTARNVTRQCLGYRHCTQQEYSCQHQCLCFIRFSKWPPLWSSDQGSWLQIQRSGFNSRRYQIFWEVMDLEWGPLSLLSTINELLKRKSIVSGLENRYYGRRDPPRLPRDTVYPQKLALTSPTSSDCSVAVAVAD